MGDYIPPEELEKFLAKCNDAKAAKAAKATADRAKIQADNVGHRLLSKMGWKEGTFLYVVLFHIHYFSSVLLLIFYLSVLTVRPSKHSHQAPVPLGMKYL